MQPQHGRLNLPRVQSKGNPPAPQQLCIGEQEPTLKIE